jgi:Leucine-rich repeat (LRR) protein
MALLRVIFICFALVSGGCDDGNGDDADPGGTGANQEENGGGPPAGCEGAVAFPDANLEAAVRGAAAQPTGDIYFDGVKDIEELDLLNAEITDLTGIQCLTGLVSLGANNNNIPDLSPLGSLTNLTMLGLSFVFVEDISPLSSLTNLQYLMLGSNNITDISALESLPNLTTLDLARNEITDISPLVSNEGIGSGDDVDITDNPLVCDDVLSAITALVDRGVALDHDCD